jgi:hypothetical protein
MGRYKTPDMMTAEEEVRSVLAWAQRMNFENIADALIRAVAKWPEPVAVTRKPPRKRLHA